ncbi:MAG: CDP-archaeol synthase [Gammaproteobacteria bacterium]
MDPWLLTTLLMLLLSANGAPVLAGVLLGKCCDWPLDNHVRFIDQRPLLGPSKTLRGFLAAIFATSVVATLLGITWLDGACFALLAMLGDLGSSFIKRRLGFSSGQSIPLLDQLPECILPAWIMQPVLGPGIGEMLAAVAAFIVIDLLLTRLLKAATAS